MLVYQEDMRNPIFRTVLIFNLLPTRYIHESWFDGIGSDTLRDTVATIRRTSFRAEKRIGYFLLRQFGADAFVFDFKSGVRWVALLEARHLLRLMFLSGLALNADWVAGAIGREQRKQVRGCIGEDGYAFALRRAPLLGVRPQLRSDLRSDMTALPLLECCLACGARCLEICLHGEPAGILNRFRLKFDNKLRWQFKPAVAAVHKPEIALLLKKILIHEIEPSWKNYFA